MHPLSLFLSVPVLLFPFLPSRPVCFRAHTSRATRKVLGKPLGALAALALRHDRRGQSNGQVHQSLLCQPSRFLDLDCERWFADPKKTASCYLVLFLCPS